MNPPDLSLPPEWRAQYVCEQTMGTSSHSAYFYVPQVLMDWAATLTGTAEESVANRMLDPAADDQQAFIMEYTLPSTVRLAR
jgi:hypothetical protein